MKILAIRIKNLASLDGLTEIDFTVEPLCSAGIFAITGSTGAGKSTILDALCLALYGQTPRYLQAREAGTELTDLHGNTIRQGDVRSILRDGTAEGFAEVDFAGIDGHRYRANWSVRRARNKVNGSIQQDVIILKNLSLNADIPGRKTEILAEITRVVGLNFEQFTRSVLLAQGDFTAFMKASKDEKSSLLEKLTGTHIYSEISRKVFEKFRAEEQHLRDLNMRRQGIVILSEEEKLALAQEQESLSVQITELDKQLSLLENEIRWYQQLELNTNSVRTAEQTLEHASQQQKESSTRKHKLYLAEHAQQTRSWVDALSLSRRQANEKQEQLRQLAESIEILRKQDSDCCDELKKLESDHAIRLKQSDEALPLLTEARRLDAILGEKKAQFENSKKEADAANLRSTEHQSKITSAEKNRSALTQKIDGLQQWKTDNQERRRIAENNELIISKLDDAQILLAAQNITVTRLADLKQQSEHTLSEKSRLTHLTEENIKQWQQLKKQFEKSTDELILIPIEQIVIDKDRTDQDILETVRAQAHWNKLYSASTTYENLAGQLAASQELYKTQSANLLELNSQLTIRQANRDTAAQMLQQSKLAAAENVEALRNSLIPDEPCPVCGSSEHPYVVHSPALHKVLEGLETAFRQKEQEYLQTFGSYSKLEQEVKTLEKTISSLETEVPENLLLLHSLQNDWSKYAAAAESETILPESRTTWFDTKVIMLNELQQKYHDQVLQYNQLQRKVEHERTEVGKLKATLDASNTTLLELEKTYELQIQQYHTYEGELKRTDTSLDAIKQQLSPYFTSPDWFVNWQGEPEAFTERIRSFTKKWEETQRQLEIYQNDAQLTGESLATLIMQAAELEAESDKKREVYINAESEYNSTQSARAEIFAGRTAAEVEHELKTALDKISSDLDACRKKQQQLTIDCATETTRQQNVQIELAAIENSIAESLSKIQQWLQQFNANNNTSLDIEVLQELLALSPGWISLERKAIKDLDDAVTMAASVLAERRQQLAVHNEQRLSERTMEQVEQEKILAKASFEEMKHGHSEIGFQFKQDQINSKQIGELLKQIDSQQQVYENWARLNDIIGSADGKKFRQIAQEYTLDVLLGYANVHLKLLTNRYRIERITSSLGLQVVDQDMGDEVRTVYSLSGGESFLVSLALALGLASLSSSRMQVESLFIDEGFGSLDPLTLNIAMDALERLHNQGRKVGVISHVQEMTERIPVQIKVSKLSSGKSKVEVA